MCNRGIAALLACLFINSSRRGIRVTNFASSLAYQKFRRTLLHGDSIENEHFVLVSDFPAGIVLGIRGSYLVSRSRWLFVRRAQERRVGEIPVQSFGDE